MDTPIIKDRLTEEKQAKVINMCAYVYTWTSPGKLSNSPDGLIKAQISQLSENHFNWKGHYQDLPAHTPIRSNPILFPWAGCELYQ